MYFLTFWQYGLNRHVWNLGCIVEAVELLFGLKAVWKIQRGADLRQLAVPSSRALCVVVFLVWANLLPGEGRSVFVASPAVDGSRGFIGTDARSQYLKLGKGALSKTRLSLADVDCHKILLQLLCKIILLKHSIILFE